MDFDFTDDQQALREAVRRWVDKGFAFERRRTLAKAGGHSRAVWGELAELGLAGLAVPESQGGLGFGPVEAMLVNEELGRGLVHAPWTNAALAVPALLAAAPEALQGEWLPRIADGSALVVLAQQERAARWALDRPATRAERRGDGWVITGAKIVVPAGDEADAFVVPARIAGADGERAGIGLFVVEAGATAITPYPTQDGARAADLRFDAAPAALIAEDGLERLEHAVDIALAGIAAEGVGLMDRLLAMTVEYLNTRRQFGVPIASFQALRHRVADAKMQLELARSMSYYATLKLGAPAAERRRAVAQARVQLGQAMRFVGQQCIQMHGGIGVTDEYAGSHYFKRLTVLELAFGDTLHHLGEVAARMEDTAGVFV
ncbi:alkylation response protein AidB-like acyl-CoA dehydrogenase [Rubrivivax gelatinosus]|uniref:acyl-CoA dehydrogenase family protein n=3 Tax=Rubrivivax gelatinosus TaxID=28068 RepID=UPI0018CA268A|nr:acyl-CoA dehydrogenase family protein [Rubrivivax gelatinosus]MBG6081356.1 alkylation response protein AidB-like acyl-CoA dehydrogenase [Rubrivivax gelatinosus]